VPIVQSVVEPATTQIFVGRAYDMTTPQLVSLFEGVGRVVDAFIMIDSAGRSKGCGIVEFSEPEAAARAIEVWRKKRHPRWSKLIVERARGRFADAAAETRAVVAGTRVRAASVERADAASEALVRAEARATDLANEALLCYEAAEARAVAAEARVALTEARARAAEARAVTALTRARAAEARVASTETRAVAAETQARAAEARVASAETRAVAAETQARAAETARVRAYATASVLRVENTGLLAKLDASEAAAAAAAARAAETENQLKALQGTILDPTHIPPSPPFYVPTVPVHPPPMVLGPIAPGSIPWSYYAPPPPPDTIFQGTVIDIRPKDGAWNPGTKYGIIRVDHTQEKVFVSPQDAPDGYLSEGDRCEFRIVEYRNSKNRWKGTVQWKAVDVVCVQRAAPQPSC